MHGRGDRREGLQREFFHVSVQNLECSLCLLVDPRRSVFCRPFDRRRALAFGQSIASRQLTSPAFCAPSRSYAHAHST